MIPYTEDTDKVFHQDPLQAWYPYLRMGIKTDKMHWTDEKMHRFADANRSKYSIAELTEMFNKKFGTHLTSRQLSRSLARCSDAPAYQKKNKYSDEDFKEAGTRKCHNNYEYLCSCT